MKKSLKSLLSLALSAVMVASALPMAMAAGTSIVKEEMLWKNWSEASYLEGRSYYIGELGVYNSWSGYTARNGSDAKHWLSDSNTTDSGYKQTAIDFRIYKTRDGNGTDPVTPPSNGGAWGYVGHNYEKLMNISDKSTIPDDLWLGVKNISAYKDNGYLVFQTVSGRNIVQYDDLYFAISLVADNKSFNGYESTGLSLPVNKAETANATWKEHTASVILGVNLKDYYDTSVGGGQTIAIPLSEFVEDPDFIEFGSKYYNTVERLYNEYNAGTYTPNLQLFSGAGIAKRDNERTLFSEVRLAADFGFKVVALPTPANLEADVNENEITLTWDDAEETDVTYRVSRTYGGNTEVVAEGVTASSYKDVVTKNGAYKYSVEAYSNTYGLVSEAVEAEATVAVSGDIAAAASDMYVEDFTVPGISGNDTTNKAKPWPFFIGDFYPSSGKITAHRFSLDGYVDRYISSEYQRMWINDSAYDATKKGRAITYRPKQAGEYYVTRDGVEYDAYIPFYVGYVDGGTYAGDKVPDEWIYDNWGFNGFRYANGVMANNLRDLSSYVDTASVAYTINIPEGVNAEGLYLAITTSSSDGSWNKNNTTTPSGQIAVGVPLEKYYDVEARGWQTVLVPMKDYDFSVDKGVNDVFVAAMHVSDGVWFNAYKDFRRYNQPYWKSFTGIGIVRNDIDDTKAEEFYFDVKNLGIVIDSTVAPNLAASFDADAKAVKLAWDASGYTETTYTIEKSNGTETVTIDAGSATSYTDADVQNGAYTYTVTSKVGKYELGGESAPVAVTVEIPEDEPVTPDEPTDSAYTVVEDIDWENWYVEGDPATNDLADRAIYVSPKGGEASISPFWNNYQGYWATDRYVLDIEINDTGYSEDFEGDIATLTYIKDASGTQKMQDIPTSDGVLWGYKGTKYLLTEDVSKIPSNWSKDRWFGIRDLSAYEDTGYFAFDVEVTDASADMANAYLAIEVATKEAEVANGKGVTLPITDEQIEANKNVNKNKWETKTTFVVGVPLTKYYDTSVMGRQKVYVPISEFVNDPAMREMYSKSTSRSVNDFTNNLANCPTNVGLFMGMGIAKKNSSDYETNPKAFNAKIYDLTVEVPNVKEPKITVTEVDLGSFAGKAWDVVVEAFDGAKNYIASFVDGAATKTGEITGLTAAETDGGSVAFAVFLHTERKSVKLNVVAE